MSTEERFRPQRLAYADPPYPGQAGPRYRGTEVDHAELIETLRTFDGWALSTSASALRDIWNLCPEARCAAWCKPYAKNTWTRVRWSWEPVLFMTSRTLHQRGIDDFVSDSLHCPPDMRGWREVASRGGGAKPYRFVRWMLELIDYRDGDELTDLFPGSGNVSTFAGIDQRELFDEAMP
jgi:hypothetical protein